MPASHLRAIDLDPPDPRAELRGAIEAIALAERSIQHAQTARDRVHATHIDAMRARDIAKAALAEATGNGQLDRLARLLGDNAAEGHALEELKRALDTAEAKLRAVQQDEHLLDDELQRRRQILAARTNAHSEAIATVLRPTADRLLARVHAHRQEIADLERALAAMPPGTLEDPYWNATRQYKANPHLADIVTSLIGALTTDPDAPIPNEVSP